MIGIYHKISKFILITLLLVIAIASFGQDNFSSATKDSKAFKNDGVVDTTKVAYVCIYRPKRFTGSAITYDLYMNNSEMTGKLIKRITSNTYYKLKLYKEGEITFWGKTLEMKNSVMVNVKFGETYYLKCGFSQGVIANRPKLEFIDNETGEQEFKSGKLE